MRTAGLAALAAVGLGAGPGAAPIQQVWRADLRIQSLDVQSLGAGGYALRLVVTSDRDDAAQSARLELLLPVGVGVLRATPGCRPSPSPINGLAGRLTCELGTIPARGTREITVAMSSPGSGARPRVAAMVMSDTPDPVPGNNYLERELP
jgi:hypothetical protein